MNYFDQATKEIKSQNEEHGIPCTEASLSILKATEEYLAAGGEVADEIGIPISINSFVDYMEAFAMVEGAAWLELLIRDDAPFGFYGSSAEDVYNGTVKMLS